MFRLPWIKRERQHIRVPQRLNRNGIPIREAGVEHTGQVLMEYATTLCGLPDLSSTNVLDVGCGTRFAATITNRNIAIKSYTGIEVDRRVVKYLKRNFENRDRRFSFHYWDVYNEAYNKSGRKLSEYRSLPAKGSFDLIWLFSVFTHLVPSDAESMLHLLRGAVNGNGHLVFSAFVDESLDGFEDRVPEKPLHNAFYGGRLIRELIERNGWSIAADHPADMSRFIQHHFVCRPV